MTAVIGVYGSASTWVFNVVRELTIAACGAETTHAFFSNAVAPVLADPHAHGRHLVWKLHQPDAEWPGFAQSSGAKILLTIRDPRDAVLSMMQRFGIAFEPACTAIFHACTAVLENAARPHLAFRYEQRFFDDAGMVAVLANHLDLGVGAAEQARIFDAYTTDRVRAFGQALDLLPADRIDQVGDATQFDRVTHIHRCHIGDQRTGKWRGRFDESTEKFMLQRLGAFVRAFGYQES